MQESRLEIANVVSFVRYGGNLLGVSSPLKIYEILFYMDKV